MVLVSMSRTARERDKCLPCSQTCYGSHPEVHRDRQSNKVCVKLLSTFTSDPLTNAINGATNDYAIIRSLLTSLRTLDRRINSRHCMKSCRRHYD